MGNGPNPLIAARNMLAARRLRTPRPQGDDTVDHTSLANVLSLLKGEGVRSLPDAASDLASYRDELATIDPDGLSRSEALAYWINLYNAGALHRAGEAYSSNYDSVLRVPGALAHPWIAVAGETLSLDDIEHGKIRRFRDPRIHGALVCGSVSCPTLRGEPFGGQQLGDHLDDQMRFFLASGGARLDRSTNTLHLTRVLKWYGGDFVRPNRMPTLIPTTRRRVASAISSWLEPDDADFIAGRRPKVVFAPYDWGLGCSVV